MSHELFNARYFGRKPAWHNLGEVFKEGENPDLVEAFTRGRLDYTFDLAPVFGVVDGNYVEYGDRRMVVRRPTIDDPLYQPIDIVSTDYSLIQNMELASIFNNLSKRWPVETVGALRKGETIFATLDCGMVEIAGEVVKRFFVLNDNKTGDFQTNIAYTPFQVVCANTLRSGLQQASLKVGVKHYKGNREKLENIALIAEQLDENSKAVDKLFGDLAKTPFSLDQFKAMVDTVLYPVPEVEEGIKVTDEFMKIREKALAERNEVVELYQEYQDTRPGLAGNLFGGFSVICDKEDFRQGRGTTKFVQAVFGVKTGIDRKTVAMNYLLDLYNKAK